MLTFQQYSTADRKVLLDICSRVLEQMSTCLIKNVDANRTRESANSRTTIFRSLDNVARSSETKAFTVRTLTANDDLFDGNGTKKKANSQSNKQRIGERSKFGLYCPDVLVGDRCRTGELTLWEKIGWFFVST